MTIPSYEEMMLPILTFLKDKKEHSNEESLEYIKRFFSVTDEEAETLLPSGKQTRLANRVAWARVYLKKAGLLDSPQRAKLKITEEGLRVLSSNPKEITD